MDESSVVLRSHNSESLNVRFFNCCEKPVEIYWVTYEGLYHLYATLKSRQFVDVNTFTKHAWIFKECGNGDQLMANNKPYFWGIDHGYTSTPRKNCEKRYVVYISRPLVLKLRSICINFICRNLKRCTDAKYLEIPITLKRDIVRKIHCLDPQSHDSQTDRVTCENLMVPF